MAPTPKLHPAVAAIVTIVLIGIATGVVVAVNRRPDTPSLVTVPSTSSSSPAPSSPSSRSTDTSPANGSSTGASSYKDGQYSATANYETPGGTETITVNLTVARNAVSAVDINQQSDSRESEEYQMMFASAYQSNVVGKNVNEINLSRVAGSSLTSLGFDDALNQIKQHAAA